jgi:hypothetical protein
VTNNVVHSDPEIMSGEPVFVGTRVPVRNLFDYLEAGDSLEARNREKSGDSRCVFLSMNRSRVLLRPNLLAMMFPPSAVNGGTGSGMASCFVPLARQASMFSLPAAQGRRDL